MVSNTTSFPVHSKQQYGQQQKQQSEQRQSQYMQHEVFINDSDHSTTCTEDRRYQWEDPAHQTGEGIISTGPASFTDDGICHTVVNFLLAGELERAEQWLASMPHKYRSKASSNKAFYHALIHACAKAGNPKAAGWCVNRMVNAGLVPNKVTFNTMINACAKAGDLELAEVWWGKMTIVGLHPNEITYNSMITAASQARDPSRAERWMEKMMEANMVSCAVPFASVIAAWAKNGRIDIAEGWLKRMLEMNVQPDVVIYNTLINASAKAGNQQKAENWHLRMVMNDLVPDAKTYNSLIHACARAGLPERAEHWLNQMEEQRCKLDHISFSSVIHAWGKVGNAAAEYWIEEMIRRGFPPNLVCYNTMVHACARDSAKAKMWFQRLVLSGLQPNKITFNSMIDASLKASEVDQVVLWLQAMIMKGFHPDNVTYSTLVNSGKHLAASGKTGGCQKRAYGSIIMAYAHAGNAQGAHRWFKDMAKASLSLSADEWEEVLQIAHLSGGQRLADQFARLAGKENVGAAATRHRQLSNGNNGEVAQVSSSYGQNYGQGGYVNTSAVANANYYLPSSDSRATQHQKGQRRYQGQHQSDGSVMAHANKELEARLVSSARGCADQPLAAEQAHVDCSAQDHPSSSIPSSDVASATLIGHCFSL